MADDHTEEDMEVAYDTTDVMDSVQMSSLQPAKGIVLKHTTDQRPQDFTTEEDAVVATKALAEGQFKFPSHLPRRRRSMSSVSSPVTKSSQGSVEHLISPKHSTFLRIVSGKVLDMGPAPQSRLPSSPQPASTRQFPPPPLSPLRSPFSPSSHLQGKSHSPAPERNPNRKQLNMSRLEEGEEWRSLLHVMKQPGRSTLVSHGKALQTPHGLRAVRDLSQGYVAIVNGGYSACPEAETAGAAPNTRIPLSLTSSRPELSPAVTKNALQKMESSSSVEVRQRKNAPQKIESSSSVEVRQGKNAPQKMESSSSVEVRQRKNAQQKKESSSSVEFRQRKTAKQEMESFSSVEIRQRKNASQKIESSSSVGMRQQRPAIQTPDLTPLLQAFPMDLSSHGAAAARSSAGGHTSEPFLETSSVSEAVRSPSASDSTHVAYPLGERKTSVRARRRTFTRLTPVKEARTREIVEAMGAATNGEPGQPRRSPYPPAAQGSATAQHQGLPYPPAAQGSATAQQQGLPYPSAVQGSTTAQQQGLPYPPAVQGSATAQQQGLPYLSAVQGSATAQQQDLPYPPAAQGSATTQQQGLPYLSAVHGSATTQQQGLSYHSAVQGSAIGQKRRSHHPPDMQDSRITGRQQRSHHHPTGMQDSRLAGRLAGWGGKRSAREAFGYSLQGPHVALASSSSQGTFSAG